MSVWAWITKRVRGESAARWGAARWGAARWIVLLAVLTVVAPVLVDLATDSRNGPFRYSASDAFYYHTIARNVAQLGFPTFDQVHPTNGFHPLWQLILAACYGLCAVTGLGERVYLLATIVIGAAFCGAAVWNLGRILERRYGRVTGFLPLVAIGPHAFAMIPLWHYAVDTRRFISRFEGSQPLYGTLWHYANGMESGLSILIFSILALRATSAVRSETPSLAAGTKDGVLIGLLVLARLDLAFVAAGLLAPFILRALLNRTPVNLRAAASRVAPACALVLGYLVVNRAYAGAWLPVSGTRKTHFPHPTYANVRALGSILEHPMENIRTFWTTALLLQMIVPALVGLALMLALVVRVRRIAGARVLVTTGPIDRFEEFLLGAGAGVVMLAVYDFAFVGAFEQGHWYFAVSNFWLSCIAATVVSRIGTERIDPVVAFGSALIALATFAVLHVRRDHHAAYAHLYYETAPKVRASYGRSPPRLVALDDGIISFSTGFPAISGFGYAIDVEAARALERAELIPLAMARGFDRLATFTYSSPVELGLGRGDRDAATRAVFALTATADSRIVAQEEFISTDDQLVILRLGVVTVP